MPRRRPDVDPSNIVLLGRSLGTYFAVALAKTRPVRGVILATPFDSFAALGEERYPWLPVGLLLNGRYDAAGDRADHQGAGAVRPGRARRRYSGGARRGAGARLGRAASAP